MMREDDLTTVERDRIRQAFREAQSNVQTGSNLTAFRAGWNAAVEALKKNVPGAWACEKCGYRNSRTDPSNVCGRYPVCDGTVHHRPLSKV